MKNLFFNMPLEGTEESQPKHITNSIHLLNAVNNKITPGMCYDAKINGKVTLYNYLHDKIIANSLASIPDIIAENFKRDSSQPKENVLLRTIAISIVDINLYHDERQKAEAAFRNELCKEITEKLGCEIVTEPNKVRIGAFVKHDSSVGIVKDIQKGVFKIQYNHFETESESVRLRSGKFVAAQYVEKETSAVHTGTPAESFMATIREKFLAQQKLDLTKLKKIATNIGLPIDEAKDIRIMYQLTEFAQAEMYRQMISEGKTYADIVNQYKNQTAISYRTTTTKEYQQYSTPAPLAYLMGKWIRRKYDNADNISVFEPSAGNGMLTICFQPEQCDLNEYEDVRFNNLCNYMQYKSVTQLDGTLDFGKSNKYDAVITNPPFGTIDMKENDPSSKYLKVEGKYEMRKKEFIMAYRALQTMKDNGRCAIIVGGELMGGYYDKLGFYKVAANVQFYNWLERYYNLTAIFNVGRGLYSQQGTNYPVRIILVDGRRPEPIKLAKPTVFEKIYDSFEELGNDFEKLN